MGIDEFNKLNLQEEVDREQLQKLEKINLIKLKEIQRAKESVQQIKNINKKMIKVDKILEKIKMVNIVSKRNWAIYNEIGMKIRGGFKTKGSAEIISRNIKINKREKLEVRECQ